MKKMLKMLTLLSILLILGSCSSSKGIVNIDTEVPDGKIAIKISIDRASFLGTVLANAPNDYNSDFDVKLKNISENGPLKPAAINQNIVVDAGDDFEIQGTYDLVGGGYSTVTPSRFTAYIYDSQSRTLRVTIKANVIGGVVSGTRVSTGPM